MRVQNVLRFGDDTVLHGTCGGHHRYERATAAIEADPDFGLALNNRALTRVVLNRDLKAAVDDSGSGIRDRSSRC
mgnify:CR=1 FL=1